MLVGCCRTTLTLKAGSPRIYSRKSFQGPRVGYSLHRSIGVLRNRDVSPLGSFTSALKGPYPSTGINSTGIKPIVVSANKTLVAMSQRRPFSSDEKPVAQNGSRSVVKEEKHEHEHSTSHSHSHSHGDDGYNYEAESIIAAFGGAADRGSRITLIGLFSNVGLTIVKGLAGWFLHSASLLADAGHSLSDLLGDFVTLFCWRLSRKPPSEQYPYGFAKFETLGTSTVSLLLIGGALGIGFHSYHLLLTALTETASTLPTGPLQDILVNVTEHAPTVPDAIAHHSHVETVDPNAAWFAIISVVIKEWLYWATKKVAEDENSPVLMANAIHHRSDAYSSIVALFAILGSWWFPALPLDPIGGLIVSVVILQQGIGLLRGAWDDLTDAGVSTKTRDTYRRTLSHLISNSTTSTPNLIAITDLRARRAGSLVYVDVSATVTPSIDISELVRYEEEMDRLLKTERKEVAELRVKFRPETSA